MKSILLAALLLSASTAAHAVIVTSALGAPDPGPAANQTLIVDFEGPAPGVVLSGSYTIATGLLPGLRAPPAGDTSNYFAVPGVNSEVPNRARIDFTNYIATNRAIRSLSFYWGSIDSYNTLEVLGRSNRVLRTITGNDINNPANGNQSDPFSNQRVFLKFLPTEQFRALRITSTGRAFELDDIAVSTVPEPQSWALLLAGFGMVGYAVRRRRHLASVAA